MKKTHVLLLVAVFAAVGSMIFIGGVQQAHATCANIGSDPDAPLHPEILRSPQFDASYSPWTTFDGYSQTPVSVTAGKGAPLLLWANTNMLDCLSEIYNGTTAIGVRPDSPPYPRRLVVKLYQQVNPGTFNLSADTLIYPDSVDPNANPETSPTSWQINMNNSGAGSQGDVQLLNNNKGFKMDTPAGGSPTKEFIGSIYFGNSLVGKSGLYLAVELWEDNPSLGGWIMTGSTVLVPISITSGTPASLNLLVDGKTSESVAANTSYGLAWSPSGGSVSGVVLYRGGVAVVSGQPAPGNTKDSQSTAGTYTYYASGNGGAVISNNVTVTVTAGAGNPSCIASAVPAKGTAPLTTSLTGTPSGGSGTYSSYAWNFGDGGTATTKTASHTYTSAGTYTAKLTVTDSNNNTGSCTTNVSVGTTCTDTTWSPDPSTQCNGVSFQQTSNCSNTRYVTGSATCYACSGSSCNAVPSGTSGYTSSDCNNTCAPPTGSCSLTATPQSGSQPLNTTFTITGANSNATYGYINSTYYIDLSGGTGQTTRKLYAPGGSYYAATYDSNNNLLDSNCGPANVTVSCPTGQQYGYSYCDSNTPSQCVVNNNACGVNSGCSACSPTIHVDAIIHDTSGGTSCPLTTAQALQVKFYLDGSLKQWSQNADGTWNNQEFPPSTPIPQPGSSYTVANNITAGRRTTYASTPSGLTWYQQPWSSTQTMPSGAGTVTYTLEYKGSCGGNGTVNVNAHKYDATANQWCQLSASEAQNVKGLILNGLATTIGAHNSMSYGSYTIDRSGASLPSSLQWDSTWIAPSTASATQTLSSSNNPINFNLQFDGSCAALSCSYTINPTSGDAPLGVSLSASAQNGTGPYSYTFVYGDGNSTTASSATQTHTYSSVGTYNTSVSVTDSAGGSAVCSASNGSTVTVSQPLPPSCTLSANPYNLLRGMSTVLSWSCSNIATSTPCTVKNDSGGNLGTWPLDSNFSGSTSDRPTKTTTYSLQCDSATASTMVNVGFFPLLREIIPRW